MVEIIGVRFRETSKVYYFGANGKKAQMGDKVIVETARGVEWGEVVIPNRQIDDNSVVQPLKSIIRIATPEDERTIVENEAKEAEIMKILRKLVSELGKTVIIVILLTLLWRLYQIIALFMKLAQPSQKCVLF